MTPPLDGGRSPLWEGRIRPKRQAVLLAMFVVALGMFGVVAWFDMRQTAIMLDMAESVDRAHSVQADLSRMLSIVDDIETGSRGFAITGDTTFLEPFQTGLKAAAQQQRRLDLLIRDPEQKASLARLKPLIAERMELARQLVELRRNAGFEAARQHVAAGEGRVVMEEIRAEFARANARVRVQLDQRSAAAKSEADFGRWLTIWGAGLSILLLITVFALVVRETSLRQRTQAQLDSFFSLSLDMLCIVRANGYLSRVNPAFTQTLGWSMQELMAQPFLDLVLPDDRTATLADIGRTHAPGEDVIPFESRYRHKDGSWRWLSWKLASGPGGFRYAIGRDVTERMQIEQQMARLNADLGAHAAEVDATNLELESFAYSVSHDLRSPLRGIDGFSQALMDDYAGELDATANDYLRRIRAAAQRMGQLIDDLLDLSKVTRAEMVMNRVDLTALARDVIEGLRPQQGGRVVEWQVNDSLTARGDGRLLQIVMENMMGNALKFTGECQRAVIEVGEQVRGDERAFFVRDNGAGFDMAYASRLFGAFQRLHDSVDFPGTGIGLATVQRIIHRHGGRVWAEAQPGNGATFYFTLPANTELAT